LELDVQWGVARDSIAKYVCVGHKGDSDFEDSEGRRSNGKGLARVYVLTDVPWRLRNTSRAIEENNSRAQVAAVLHVASPAAVGI